MKEQFLVKRFHRKSELVIDQANEIIDEYAGQGFSLTLRQLYYQFVARDYIANSQNSYNKLGKIINNARLAGLIDWLAIEDRTRNLRGPEHWEGPDNAFQEATDAFAIDKWATQDYHIEVWIEKDALVGVIEGVCMRNDIDFFSCRGYTSQSEQYRAGKRLRHYYLKGQAPIILHLGDHDPSGMDMTRDNKDRLIMFAETPVKVQRLALNWPQVKRYKPPPNPAKMTDSRAPQYVSEFGKQSWELDALEPKVLADLIQKAVDKYRDQKAWDKEVRRENKMRKKMQKATNKLRLK